MRTYIIDTTVLLYDSQSIFAFDKDKVLIPITVIEELDRFKKDLSERGRNARQASRIIDALRRRGSLTEGVKTKEGGILYVVSGSEDSIKRVPKEYHEKKRDVYILAAALDEKALGNEPSILTKDLNLRIKADSLGILAENYESEKLDIKEFYTGQKRIDADKEDVEELKSGGVVNLPVDLHANQYVLLVDKDNHESFAYGRYEGATNNIVPLMSLESKNYNISSRNREQAFALDALLNDDIRLVTLVGKAGTGKTLLAVAASIHKTVDEDIYNRILVARPTLPMGQDIGYLPGTVEEKLTPWMYPIADNVELIMRNYRGGSRKARGFKELVDLGILVIEPLTYIRGRSIHSQYLIIDEAQNLTPHEVKTIITRAGDGTKVILTGDPYQIDNPYVDSVSNGLTTVVEKFKDEKVTAHITLTKGERSELSELAANNL